MLDFLLKKSYNPKNCTSKEKREMKKILSFALTIAAAAAFAAGDGANADAEMQSRAQAKYEKNVWPAFFALSQIPHATDVVGLRLTIPYSTSQDNITGLDLGFWGRSLYMQGIQVNLLRNDVADQASGIQVGIYNSIGHGELLGIQAGLWNEAFCQRGIQVGLVNVAGEAQGFQFGLINRAETLYGYQVGLVNVIRSAEVPFFPIINIGF